MRAVAIGSSAEAGSSIRMTSGLIAIARAMHRRCCWPPDRPVPGWFRRSFTSSQSPARTRLLDDLVEIGLAPPQPVDARTVCDVLVDRLGKRVGLLEHHPDASPELDDVQAAVVDVLTVDFDPAVTRADGIVSFIRLMQRRKVDLPQPDGPMKAVTARSRISTETSYSACLSP